MHIKRKTGLAVGTFVAIFLVMAAPAAAAPVSIQVTGALLETTVGDFDLTPVETPCNEDVEPGNVSFEAVGDGEQGSWAVNGAYKGRFRLDDPPVGPWYQATFTLNGSGDYTGTPYILDGLIVVQVDIHQLSPPDCEKDNHRCTFVGAFGITDGEFNGFLPDPSVGDTAMIDADTASGPFGPLVTAQCPDTSFVVLNGTHASLTGMTFEVVP